MIVQNTALGKDVFKMQNQKGDQVILELALSRAQHTKGLSGIKSSAFNPKSGMLFVNTEVGPRRFWMPDTYFDLDIIFLDQNLMIVGLEQNVPAHPGKKDSPPIYKTDTYTAQFVLEIKSKTKFGATLKKGDQLKFIGPLSLSEIILKTRQQQ